MSFPISAALLDAIVLSVVAQEPEGTYGYKITQQVTHTLELSESTLYPVLRRLQKDQLLTAGRIDATLNADVSFYDYLNVHPDADFKLVAQTEDASHVAIPVRKGDDSASLLEAINTAIEELRADGTLKALGEKYFGQDISSED